MPQTQSNSPTKTRPKTTSLPPQASTFPPTTEERMYKSSIIAKTIPKEMATKTPVEIGSRGTVGSLIMQEIEYFSRLELGCQGSSQKPHCQFTDMGSTSNPRPKLGSLIMAAKKKKRGGSRLVPSMCSMVEVADRNPPNGIAGFSYRNLKADVKKVQA